MMLGRDLFRQMGNPRWYSSQFREIVLRARDRFSDSEFSRFYRQVRPYTMSSDARLRGLYEAVKRVHSANIAGDIVECGTARGGSAALLGLTMKRANDGRTLWVFDTFEGLPPPTDADPDADIANLYVGKCRGELAEVTALFERLGLTDRVRCVKGLFQQTVPAAPLSAIAVLHLDGDWYESVMVCLQNLYDRVSPGGIIQIDDYGHWEGAREAVHDFFQTRNLSVTLQYLDYAGRQFMKPRE